MNQDKLLYLEQDGYKPVTDEIIRESFKSLYENAPHIAKEKETEAKEKFKYYKRYGSEIMLYSMEYLERNSIDELKRNAIKTERRFL
ncbi:hypothetical protein P9597_02415 [Aneurinibacillus migulanus]|uniref:hypothetical protein n=1 Tax=Aneurinibacillus migulanus TaxID=47500 RepID=UPI002E1B1C10|nr:hypothetical protein [Aneurinibacillus migulanus]